MLIQYDFEVGALRDNPENMHKWGTLRDLVDQAEVDHPNVLNVLDLPLGGMTSNPPPRYE
jgi:hypothetical protein